MNRPELDALVAGEATPEDLDALRALATQDRELAVELRLLDALAASEREAWTDASTPPLRYVPDGAGRSRSAWARLGLGGDARGPAIGAPFVAVAASLVLVVGLLGGFLLGGAADDDPPGGIAVADVRLETAPAVSLVRATGAPEDAGGVARMIAGKDGRMMVRVHGLRPTAGDRFYEVWMRGADGRTVSVGRFRVRPDGTGTARFRLTADPGRSPSMDVTLQSPADGNVRSDRSVLRSPSAA
jgi:hypothetical protein